MKEDTIAIPVSGFVNACKLFNLLLFFVEPAVSVLLRFSAVPRGTWRVPMNCRRFLGFGMATAMLAASMLLPVAHAQASSPNNSAQAAAGSTKNPAEVYHEFSKRMIGGVVSAAEAMPADKYNFAPTAGKFDGVRNFGAQVQHLVEANYFFFSGFGVSGAMDDAKIKNLKSKDELVQALKDSVAYADKAIDTITPENAYTEVALGKQQITRAGAATLYVAHSMDHYGQMVEYLRMNGIVPPASQKQQQGD
jgi:uncharacterized damage-inducible protein DinB